PHLHSFPTRRSSDLHAGETARYCSRAARNQIFFGLQARFPEINVKIKKARSKVLAFGVKAVEPVIRINPRCYPGNFPVFHQYIQDRKSTRLNSSHVK